MNPGNLLEKILRHKRDEVADSKRRVPEAVLVRRIADVAPPLPLAPALSRSVAGELAVIAEMKKASPSAGVMRADFRPQEIAANYAQAGANALSVLTDSAFFGGALQHIADIRSAVSLPILRKDFIIDPYQVLEARAFGADAVLLIVAALEPAMLRRLLGQIRDLGMAALVEVHNPEEITAALAAGASIVGINNRDLTTFTIDLATTERLAPLCGENTIVVAESGIRSADDVHRMAAAGVAAILVGSHFMAHADPGRALVELKKAMHYVASQDLRHH